MFEKGVNKISKKKLNNVLIIQSNVNSNMPVKKGEFYFRGKIEPNTFLSQEFNFCFSIIMILNCRQFQTAKINHY